MAKGVRYHKSEAGQHAFKQRSPELSARQRSVFLLFDGQRSVADVLATTSGLGATQSDVDDLIAKGFLIPTDLPSSGSNQPVASASAPASTTAPATATDAPTPVSPADQQTLYRQAYPIATKLTASLGLRGFRLNLAVEAASGYADLVTLLPQITQAVGETAGLELKKALNVN